MKRCGRLIVHINAGFAAWLVLFSLAMVQLGGPIWLSMCGVLLLGMAAVVVLGPRRRWRRGAGELRIYRDRVEVSDPRGAIDALPLALLDAAVMNDQPWSPLEDRELVPALELRAAERRLTLPLELFASREHAQRVVDQVAKLRRASSSS